MNAPRRRSAPRGFFVEFNPLSAFTGGENGLPGVPTPSFNLGIVTLRFDTNSSMYAFLAFWYFVGLVIALHIVRSPVGAILSALRDNPLRAAALGHNIHGYKLTAFVVAAAYAGFAGGLLGVLQGFMPPDAFMFDTSGQLVMQTAIGGAGTLVGPLVGATVWLYLSDFLQNALHLGATWKLVLGIVFVLLVCFLRRGIVGAIVDLWGLAASRRRTAELAETTTGPTESSAAARVAVESIPARRHAADNVSGPILNATGLTKRYGGLVANSDIDFVVNHGEIRGIIGPNGAGKSTLFKMLTCEVPPTSGGIVFEGRDITGMSVTRVCQLGLTKSYQINQLFDRLTVRQNLRFAALGQIRGEFKLDLFRSLRNIPGLDEQVEQTLALVNLTKRPDTPVSELAYGEKRRLDLYGPRVAGGRRNPDQGGQQQGSQLHPQLAARVRPRWRLEDYLRRLDEGDVEDGATSVGARTKDLAEKIAALCEKRSRLRCDVGKARTNRRGSNLADRSRQPRHGGAYQGRRRLQHPGRCRREEQADRRTGGDQPGRRHGAFDGDRRTGPRDSGRRDHRCRRRSRLLQDRGHRGL